MMAWRRCKIDCDPGKVIKLLGRPARSPTISLDEFARDRSFSRLISVRDSSAALLDLVTTTLADVRKYLQTPIQPSTILLAIHSNRIQCPAVCAPTLHLYYSTLLFRLSRSTSQTGASMAYMPVTRAQYIGTQPWQAQLQRGRACVDRSTKPRPRAVRPSSLVCPAVTKLTMLPA